MLYLQYLSFFYHLKLSLLLLSTLQRFEADQERQHSVEARSRSGFISEHTIEALHGERHSSYDHDFRDPLIATQAVEEALIIEEEEEEETGLIF